MNIALIAAVIITNLFPFLAVYLSVRKNMKPVAGMDYDGDFSASGIFVYLIHTKRQHFVANFPHYFIQFMRLFAIVQIGWAIIAFAWICLEGGFDAG